MIISFCSILHAGWVVEKPFVINHGMCQGIFMALLVPLCKGTRDRFVIHLDRVPLKAGNDLTVINTSIGEHLDCMRQNRLHRIHGYSTKFTDFSSLFLGTFFRVVRAVHVVNVRQLPRIVHWVYHVERRFDEREKILRKYAFPQIFGSHLVDTLLVHSVRTIMELEDVLHLLAKSFLSFAVRYIKEKARVRQRMHVNLRRDALSNVIGV